MLKTKTIQVTILTILLTTIFISCSVFKSCDCPGLGTQIEIEATEVPS